MKNEKIKMKEMKNEKIKIKNEERQEKRVLCNKADLYQTTAKADRIRKKYVHSGFRKLAKLYKTEDRTQKVSNQKLTSLSRDRPELLPTCGGVGKTRTKSEVEPVGGRKQKSEDRRSEFRRSENRKSNGWSISHKCTIVRFACEHY